MKCPLCGCQFREEGGNIACKGCPLAKACRMIKCPNCGYEVPEEPKIIKAFKAWGETKQWNWKKKLKRLWRPCGFTVRK